MKHLLLVLTVAVSACGSSTPEQAGGTQVYQQDGTVVFELISTLEPDCKGQTATINITRPVTVSMPAVLTALSNAGYSGRATLSVGTYFCDFLSDTNGVYVRQNGSCNSFSPDKAIKLKAGDSVSLLIQGCPTQHTSVDALVSGNAI